MSCRPAVACLPLPGRESSHCRRSDESPTSRKAVSLRCSLFASGAVLPSRITLGVLVWLAGSGKTLQTDIVGLLHLCVRFDRFVAPSLLCFAQTDTTWELMRCYHVHRSRTGRQHTIYYECVNCVTHVVGMTSSWMLHTIASRHALTIVLHDLCKALRPPFLGQIPSIPAPGWLYVGELHARVDGHVGTWQARRH